MRRRPQTPGSRLSAWMTVALTVSALATAADGGGVFVRLKLVEPAGGRYYVRLGGYIHVSPWYLKRAVIPLAADKDAARRLPAGQWTGWFDLKAHAGKLLHGRMNRSGGVAEFPNVTAEFVADDQTGPTRRKALIELATAPDPTKMVKRFEEAFTGPRTSFLVSPKLAADAAGLESLSQMQARHLRWAREATGGKRVSPKRHILQTSFYGPTIKGAEVLWLLGLNVVGHQTDQIHAKFPALRRPGHTHRVAFGPAATREQIDELMKAHAARQKTPIDAGAPFGLADEICCRPRIGTDEAALRHFHAYLAERGVAPAELGVERLTDVVPIETPEALRERQKVNDAAARRVFYHTSRFRQHAGTERIRWHTEAFHRHFAAKVPTSTLVADHPYFGGTGLGMGMRPNTTWGGAPLALDWFDLARRRSVDLAAIEDWMGLQYMYGPFATWEGFQLMGFQASIFRSGAGGRAAGEPAARATGAEPAACATGAEMGTGTFAALRSQSPFLPIIAWITPSDETNLRLKTASALCQGAKHFFYWTYGPTCFGTENYWSDLRGEYDGIASVARHLAAAEHIVAPGLHRPTRVALLYSISSDLWQPLDYVHMLERRATYLSLVHDQHLVDMLTEQDVEAGRLGDYDVLYTADPCITSKAAAAIVQWVRDGGVLYGSCAAGSLNEFGESADGLAEAFGIRPRVTAQPVAGEYRIRGRLNGIQYADTVGLEATELTGPAARFGVIGAKVAFTPAGAKVVGRFADGETPAATVHALGRGRAVYFAACPGISYLKDAKFVPRELKERYPAAGRRLINAPARAAGAIRPVELSEAVVEAGVYDAPAGTAVVLANFTYRPIDKLTVRLPLRRAGRTARSVEHGPLKLTLQPAKRALREAGYLHVAAVVTKLELTDILLFE